MDDYRKAIKDHLNNIYNFAKAQASAEYRVPIIETTAAFIAWLESQSRILSELHQAVLDSRIRRSVLASDPATSPVRIGRVFEDFSDSEVQKGEDLLAILSVQAAREDVVVQREVDLVSYTWSAILDRRVCPVCLTLDGTTWEANDPTIIHPPIHFRCRCLLVGTMRDAIYRPAITGLPKGYVLPTANQRFHNALGGFNARKR
jgi:hypothetical protein